MTSLTRVAQNTNTANNAKFFNRTSTIKAADKFQKLMNDEEKSNSAIPNIIISIDHNDPKVSMIAENLVKKGIDVTVFIQCKDKNTNNRKSPTDGKVHRCVGDIKKASQLYAINNKAGTIGEIDLGIHTNDRRYPTGTPIQQKVYTSALYKGIANITKQNDVPLSYHGINAKERLDSNGKNSDIPLNLENKIRWARSIVPTNGNEYYNNPLNIPVLANTTNLKAAREIIQKNALHGQATHFFFHAHDLESNKATRNLYEFLTSEITSGRYKSAPFPR
jgi:hypothetical protein